jgi:hypothetical protein
VNRQPLSLPDSIPILLLALVLSSALGLAGCAGHSGPVGSPGVFAEGGAVGPASSRAPREVFARPGSSAAVSSAGPDRVFPTVESAVRDALASAVDEGGPLAHRRLRLGTIRRVEGGFAWSAPVRSRDVVTATRPMRVRLRLGPDDVAIYGLHPRSGRSELDRLNEGVSGSERRLVDEQDPLHRPLYILTPSRRILRYPDGPEAVEVVSREADAARR